MLVEMLPIDELCSRAGPVSLACIAQGYHMVSVVTSSMLTSMYSLQRTSTAAAGILVQSGPMHDMCAGAGLCDMNCQVSYYLSYVACRRGCFPYGNQSNVVPLNKRPCMVCNLLQAKNQMDGWLRVEKTCDKDDDGVVIKKYRAATRNKTLRLYTTFENVTMSAMYADVVEDDSQRRSGGIITDPTNPASLRNFTPELWQQVGGNQGWGKLGRGQGVERAGPGLLHTQKTQS